VHDVNERDPRKRHTVDRFAIATVLCDACGAEQAPAQVRASACACDVCTVCWCVRMRILFYKFWRRCCRCFVWLYRICGATAVQWYILVDKWEYFVVEHALVPACAQACTACGVVFGEYFCSVCRLYDDDTSKKIFHCKVRACMRAGAAASLPTGDPCCDCCYLFVCVCVCVCVCARARARSRVLTRACRAVGYAALGDARTISTATRVRFASQMIYWASTSAPPTRAGGLSGCGGSHSCLCVRVSCGCMRCVRVVWRGCWLQVPRGHNEVRLPRVHGVPVRLAAGALARTHPAAALAN
jgi:hypothetical protein